MNSLNINKRSLSEYIAITKMGTPMEHRNMFFRVAKQGFESLQLREFLHISNEKIKAIRFEIQLII